MADTFGIRMVKRAERPAVQFATKLKNPICVEVGTFKGGNALRILKKLKPSTLYVVDPWLEEAYTDYKKGTVNECYIEAMNRLMKYIKRGLVKVIRDYSITAIGKIPKADFIYLDGNHTYEYLKKEIPLYWNKLNHGGILAGHDIGLPEVARAVSEFVAEKGIYPIYSEPDWFFEKK